MKRFTLAVAAMASFAAGCTSSPSSASHGHLARCAAQALVLRPAAPVPSMTGEHAVLYTLANRGPAACTVRGYPQITLYDAHGRVLPFRYADGGGAYVTARKPVTVVLGHGAMAYILAAKYRCDLGIAHNAATIQLALPAAGSQVFSSRQPLNLSGPPGLSYCRGGLRDPGQLVTISPIEKTPAGDQQPALTTDPGSEPAILPRPCRQYRQRADSGMTGRSPQRLTLRNPRRSGATQPVSATLRGLCNSTIPISQKA